MSVPSRESRRQEKFEKRMEAAVAMKESRRERRKRRRPKRRGIVGQRKRREDERTIRSMAVALLRWALLRGRKLQEVARRLFLSPFTLREWWMKWKKGKMEVKEVGRLPDRGDRELRNQAIALFGLMGPDVGIPTLRQLLPEASRAELEELKRRYAHAFKKHGWVAVHALRWLEPGTVWSMDFTTMPCILDGLFREALLVRDLPSRAILEALGTESQNSDVAIDLLSSLFSWHGPSLVLKADNGSGFIAEKTRAFLASWRVKILYSPPGTPEYNGSVESGAGSAKTLAWHEAARNDRSAHWTLDDLYLAKCRINSTVRPDDPFDRTPDAIFYKRKPIPPERREAFDKCYRKHEIAARQELGYLPEIELSREDQAKVDRIAIPKALVEQDYLLFRRRRIPLPFSRKKFTRISQG